jgi:hypothetical protein
MFPGSPSIKLSPVIGAGVNPTLANEIRQQSIAQQDKTNRDLAGFNVYPVLSIGVSYSF